MFGGGPRNCRIALIYKFRETTEKKTLWRYANLDMYELAKEASTVLELALWKMKIDERVVSNIDDQSSRKKAKVEEEMSPRNLCRINCGADIIIPGVLHYLEPKPVEVKTS